MNGIKTEDMGSRKKYLAPLAVLIVCMLSLTGAAYAYTSTMTNTENTIQEDFISIDLATPDYSTDIVVGNVTALAFTDDFKYTKVEQNIVKTDTVKCTVTETSIVYSLKIKGDVACNAVKVQSTNIAAFLATALGNDKTLDNIIDVKVGLTNSSASATAITANNTPVTLSLAGDDAKTAQEDAQAVTVYVFFALDAQASNPYTVVSEGNCTVTAQTCYNALANAKFDLVFSVEPQA